MATQQELITERFRITLELFEVGQAMLRQKLRRRYRSRVGQSPRRARVGLRFLRVGLGPTRVGLQCLRVGLGPMRVGLRFLRAGPGPMRAGHRFLRVGLEQVRVSPWLLRVGLGPMRVGLQAKRQKSALPGGGKPLPYRKLAPWRPRG